MIIYVNDYDVGIEALPTPTITLLLLLLLLLLVLVSVLLREILHFRVSKLFRVRVRVSVNFCC